MSSSPQNYNHQGFIIRNTVLAVSISAAFAAVFYSRCPLSLPPMPTVVDRWAFTLKWNVLSVSVVLFMMIFVGNRRFLTGQHNPFSSTDKDKIEIHVRVLQNTIEQFLIGVPLQVITAAWIGEEQMRIIPILVILFVVGRFLFWIGYLDPSYGHTRRSIGLPLTTFPNVGMAVYCTYRLINDSIVGI